MSVRRPRFEDEESAQSINISPLIDVIFILLLFFILTSSFSKINALGVDVPTASNADESVDKPLEISILENGDVRVGQSEISLNVLASYVEANSGGAVVICSDTRASAGRLVEVMDILKGAGISDVYIAAKK